MDRCLPARRSGVRGVGGCFAPSLLLRPRISFRSRTIPICALVVLLSLTGCATPQWVTFRQTPHNPLADRLMLLSTGGPRPTERTLIFLRRYDLEGQLGGDSNQLVQKVQAVIDREPSPEAVAAAAELSYIGGVKSEALAKPQEAFDLFGTSVVYSYAYLFNPAFTQTQNGYDPQFRGACDLYNAGLEAELRALNKQGKLRPGEAVSVQLKGQTWDVSIEPRNVPWPPGDIDHFEFVSDYEIHGLRNVYHTYGLGVPLIAVRAQKHGNDPAEKHYAPGLCFPVTAFVRCLPDEPAAAQQTAGSQEPTTNNGFMRMAGHFLHHSGQQPVASSGLPANPHHHAVLELYDPLQSTDIVVQGRHIPLESDITTPLAYALNDPAFQKLDQPTEGLLHPSEIKKLAGIYMLEPYSPGKIPVLMIHGLWSSPITWMEMFNDLRGDPTLRSQYQFWFYLYPTGQPFWRSATQLREALAEVRNTFDPTRHEAALDQTVLVGHSMGGLIANMQIVNSRDDFWHIVSNQPVQEVKGDEKTKLALERTFYFQASPSIRRIITIGTPHRGSYVANDVTRYLGERLISLPNLMTARFAALRVENPGFFRDTKMLDTETSIDSLAPDSPVLPVLLAAQRPPWVRYDNIVGRLPRDDWQVRIFGDGDGVVPYSSAHLAQADSEITVPAEHDEVQSHPQTIFQVRQILMEHLREVQTAYPLVLSADSRNAATQIAGQPK